MANGDDLSRRLAASLCSVVEVRVKTAIIKNDQVRADSSSHEAQILAREV